MKKIILFFIVLNGTTHTFNRLSDVLQYAHKHEEFPPGNHDWHNPDYSDYHQRIRGNFLYYLSRLFFDDIDLPSLFQTRLNTYLQQTNLSKANETIIKISDPKARVFVWSDLHGAFHSLTRALEWLHKQEIINEQLEIIKPNHYFIFNGDAINRSPYILETLTLVITLLNKNPEHVFYTVGNHEYKGHWKNFNLRKELRLRAGKLVQLTNGGIPLEQELDQFFASLPLAIYLSNPKKSSDLIRISHFSRAENIVDEYQTGTFLTDHSNKKTEKYNTANKEKSRKNIDVKAIILSEHWKNARRLKEGLSLLNQNVGSIAWSIFSSPTSVYQKHMKFFYDAFAIIDIQEPIAKSTITLVNRNIKNSDDFQQHEPCNIMSGIPISNPKSFSGKKEVMFGTSIPLEQGLPVIGNQILRGAMTRINKENTENGGVNGHIIRFEIKNDDYTPNKARKNIKEFISRGIDTLCLHLGSPTLVAYLDLIKSGEIAEILLVNGAPQFRDPSITNIINVNATYADEVYALIDYVYTELGARRFAFFYQNDSYGIGPLKAAHKTLKELGITEWTDVPYLRASANLREQANKIQEVLPDAIGLFSTAQPTQELIRQLGIANVANKTIFAISPLTSGAFARFRRQHGIPVILGSVTPNPKLSTIPLIQEYREEMTKNNYQLDEYSLEAYINMSLIIEAMKKIDGDITKEKILKTLRSFTDFDLKGLSFGYNPQRNDLTKHVYIELGDDVQWLRKDVNRETV